MSFSKKRLIALVVIGVLIIICIVLGITYSFMRPINETSSITSVNLESCANITLTDTGESIDLENTYPMSRNRALQTTPYTFTISSTCETYVGFNLYLVTLSSNTLPDSSIHYIITEQDSKEALAEGILSEATNALSDFETHELDELNNGINGNYGTIYNIFSGDIPYQGEISYDLYLYIDGTVTNETMGQTFSAGVAVKSYEREPDPTSLALDISLGNIVINEGSTENTLYVSGGGLSEQIEIDNTLPIVITGTTEQSGIDIYGGTSNITLKNVSITGALYNGIFRLLNDSVVNLNIEGENTLDTAESGIGILVSRDTSLTISGAGVLNVTGDTGIGTAQANSSPAGTIIINSGTINATGTGAGAAIGGYGFNLIEINGGNITAISNDYGAGIGGAGNNNNLIPDLSNSEIRINGGTIYAKGGMLSAGIGAGGAGESVCVQSTAPNIYISDSANVTAIAGGVYNDHDTPPENIGSGGFSC